MLVSMKSDKSSILKNIVSLFSLRFYFIFSEPFFCVGMAKTKTNFKIFFRQKTIKISSFHSPGRKMQTICD